MKDIAVGQEITPIRKELTLVAARLYTLPLENFHTHDHLAQKLGLPGAVPQGLISYGYLSELCTRFFGPGWARGGKLYVNFIGMLRPSYVLTARGRVTAKEPEGDKTRVTLGIWLENQAGEKVAVGTASGLLS